MRASSVPAVMRAPTSAATLCTTPLSPATTASPPSCVLFARRRAMSPATTARCAASLAEPSATARPQMHVEGAIELGRIAAAVSVTRPAGAADDAAVDLYRLDADGRGAQRMRVQLGRGPAERVQVRSGLVPGDVVIVSDTSAVAGEAPRITLK